MEHNYFRHYMEYCIKLAAQCPPLIRRPFVGAIVINDKGDIVGEGYKQFIPATGFLLHAERVAIEYAGTRSKGATLITSLEPCITAKRNQIMASCATLIVNQGIRRVVFGCYDNSSSIYNGCGQKYLEQRGVEVIPFLEFSDDIDRKLLPHKIRKQFS